MYRNEIDMDELKDALKAWTTGADGENGGTVRVTGTLPWTEEMNRLLPWDAVMYDIDEAIGLREEFSLTKIVCGDLAETKRLDDWASARARDIYAAYDEAIKRLNAAAGHRPAWHARLTRFTAGDGDDHWIETEGTYRQCISNLISDYMEMVYPNVTHGRRKDIARLTDFIIDCTKKPHETPYKASLECEGYRIDISNCGR